MAKNAKLGIAAGAVLLVAIVMMFVVGNTLLAIAVVALGGFGVYTLKDRLPDDEYLDDEPDGKPKAKTDKKGKPLKGKKALDALLEGQNETAKTKKRPVAPPPIAPSSGEGLPTWGGGFETATDDDIEVVEDDAPAAESDWDSWDSEWSEDGGGTDTLEVDDPLGNLDELDQLDEVDPIAEVERLDALKEEDEEEDEDNDYDPLGGLDEESFNLDDFEVDTEVTPPAASGGGFSFGSAPPVINEHVESADDIMAASQATEFVVEDDAADSELARLLAKVQARLAAYE